METKSSKELDKYYTKQDVADKCIATVKYVCQYKRYVWIEPSAGEGAFLNSDSLVSMAYDLQPEKCYITKADWFDVEHPKTDFALIGNPPFGKRNKLSKEFIKKGVKDPLCKVIAFILPSVYEKHTLQEVFPSDWTLIHSERLPKNSFTLDGDDYDIPCVFQVWQRIVCLRAKERETFENKHFKISSKSEADIYVLGASPNTVKTIEEVSSTNRGYYLKVFNSVAIDNIKNLKWNGKSCASGGVAWLTRTEFMNQYEAAYQECL